MYMKATKLQQKQIIALLALVLLGLSGLFIGFQALPPTTNTADRTIDITPVTTPTKNIPMTTPGQAQEQVGLIDKPITERMNQPLYDYYTTGVIPEIARTYNGKLGVMLTALNTIDVAQVHQYMDIMWIAHIGSFTLITGTIDNPNAIDNLFALDGTLYMTADFYTRPEDARFFKQVRSLDGDLALMKLANGELTMPRRFDSFMSDLELAQAGSGIVPTQELAVKEMGGDTYASQYNGTGVTIGIVDTGTDFGNSDLSKALALDNGLPLTIDPGSFGIALTGMVFTDSDGDGIGELDEDLSFNSTEYKVYVAGAGFAASLKAFMNFYGFSLPDTWELPTTTSVSGNYLFGVIAQAVPGVVPYQLAFFMLVDSSQAGVYDTLFIDFDTSAALNWYFAGLIDIPLNAEFDYSFADETPYTWSASSNPEDFVLARDFDGDGVNDFSVGSLSVVLDPDGVTDILANVTGKFTENITADYIIEGIDPNGTAIGFMFDHDGHGTWTASAAGARGLVNYTISYSDYDGPLKWKVVGSAPGAEIAASKFFSNFDLFASYLYLLGFDVMYNTTTEAYEWSFNTARDGAEILSNSWGYSNNLAYGLLTGFNPDSFFIDLLSLPGVADPNYNGALFVFSQGNSGNGYGNSPAPEPTLGLKVGASTAQSYRMLGSTWGGARNGHLVDFSSAGPNDIGVSTPDVLAPGAYAYSASPVWFQTLLTGRFPDGNTSVDLWGGTSLSAPFAAGAAAVAWQAYSAFVATVNPLDVRLAIINTATNRGLAPSLQGTGIINITRLVEAITDVNGAEITAGNRFLASNGDSIALAYQATSLWYNFLFGSSNGYLANFAYDFNSYPDNFNATKADFTGLQAGHVYAGIMDPGDTYQTNVTLQGDTASVTASAVYVQKTKTLEYDLPIITASSHPFYDLSDNLTGQDLTDFQNADGAFIQVVDPSGTMGAFGLFFVRLYDWVDDGNGTIDDNELFLVQQNLDADGITDHVGMYISDPGSIFQGTPLLWIYAGVLVNESSLTLKIDLYNYMAWSDVSVNQPSGFPGDTYNVTVTAPSEPGYYEGFLKFTDAGYTVYMPVTFMVRATVDTFGSMVPLATTTETNDASFKHSTARIDGPDGSRLSFPFVTTYNLTANDKADANLHIHFVQDDPYDYYEIGLADLMTGEVIFIYDGGATTSNGLMTHLFASYDMGYYLVFVQAIALNGGTGNFNLSVAIEDPVPLNVAIDFDTGDFYNQIRGVDAQLRANFTGRADIESRGFAVDEFTFIVNAPTPPTYVEDTFDTPPTTGTSIDDWVSFDFNAGDIVTWSGGDPDGAVDFDVAVFDPTSGVNPDTYPIGSDLPFGSAISFGATAASIESGSFIAPVSGTYWFAIDQWGSGGDNDWFVEVIVSAPLVFTDNDADDQNSANDIIIIDPETSGVPDGQLVLEAYVDVNYAFEDVMTGYFYDSASITLDWQLPAVFDSVSMTIDGTDYERPAVITVTHDSSGTATFTLSDPNNDKIDFTLTLESFAAIGSTQTIDIGLLLASEINVTSGGSVTYEFDFSDLGTWFGLGSYYLVAEISDHGAGGSGETSTYSFVINIELPAPPTETSAPETTTPTGGAAPGFELLPLIAALSLAVPVIIIKRRRK